MSEVKEDNNDLDVSTMIKVCKGKRKSHNGYRWIFATEDMKVGDVVSFN